MTTSGRAYANPPAARTEFPAAPASAEPDGQAEGGELLERPVLTVLDVVDPAQHRRPVGLGEQRHSSCCQPVMNPGCVSVCTVRAAGRSAPKR